MSTNVTAATHIGAIMMVPGDAASDIAGGSVVWVVTKDFQKLLDADDGSVIIADNWADLDNLIQDKYPSQAGTTLIEKTNQVFLNGDKERYGRRGRRFRHRSHEDLTGYKVLKYPQVTETKDVNELKSLAIEYRYILVDGACVRRPRGEDGVRMEVEEHLRSNGFVVTTSGQYLKLRYAPLNAKQQGWRRQVEKVEEFLVDELPGYVKNVIGHFVNPNQWPEDHPWHGVVRGQDNRDQSSGWGRARTKSRQSAYSIKCILQYTGLSKKLWPGHYPWRECTQYSYGYGNDQCPFQLDDGRNITFASVVAEALKYIHGMEKSDGQWQLKLAKWLRLEAKALKVKIPPPPVTPKKPTMTGMRLEASRKAKAEAEAVRARTANMSVSQIGAINVQEK